MFSKKFEYMVIFFQIHVLHFLNDNNFFLKLHKHSFTWFNIFIFAYAFCKDMPHIGAVWFLATPCHTLPQLTLGKFDQVR